MKTTKSSQLFSKAKRLIPGGVNSPVRAFRSVGGTPLAMKKAKGAYMFDLDGNRYIDYVLSWGPMILGHAHPKVLESVVNAVKNGTSFGTSSEQEMELAELVTQAMPSVQQVRLVNSGTEATMSAIRLARAYTKRDTIVKFEGCYHGHADHLLVKAGSGVATLGIPDSPGVPKAFAGHTLTAPYNNIKALEQLFKKQGKKIACVIVEPIAGNMGVVPPHPEFLPALRALTKKHGSLLIFDEVMTGFRVHLGGAQAIYKVKPDLTCLGKVIGGGLPIGAYGGRKDIMQLIAPAGPVYQAGTLSGNPVAVVAGIETLKCLQAPGVYQELEQRSNALAVGLGEVARQAKVSFYQARVGSMLGGFFTKKPVTDYASAKKSDTDRYAKFFHGMLKQGVYLAPSQFEAAFLSAAHKPLHIRQTIEAAAKVFRTFR